MHLATLRRFIVLDLQAVAGAAEHPQIFSVGSKGSATLSSALVHHSTPSQHYHRGRASVANAISLYLSLSLFQIKPLLPSLRIARIKYQNG